MGVFEKTPKRGKFKLLIGGRLNEYLHEVYTQCYERIEFLVEQMKAGAGITKELKATDQMKWVGLMNNVRSSAEENLLKADICVVWVRSVMLRIHEFLVLNNFCYDILILD